MIAGFFGMMSSGKGVLSTKFLRECRKKNYKRIISNCFLNTDNVTVLRTDELYEKSRVPNYFKNSYLYITELHSIIDARRSSSLLNTNFTQFLTQVGKQDCKVIYDSQLFGQIDLRMREFTPIRYICKRYKLVNNKLVEPDFFDDRILDVPIAIAFARNWTDELGREHIQMYQPYFPVKEDYDFYDTREVIYLDREKYLKR